MGELFSLLLKILYFLIVFGIIILLTYYITKVVGRRFSKNTGKYIGIIDVLHLGSDRCLVIIKVKDAYMLMSSTGRGIELIKELKDFEEKPKEKTSFSGHIRDYDFKKYETLIFPGLFRKPKSDGDNTDE